MESSVASGIGSPYRATPAMPATCVSHSISAPAALRILTVALLMDGPMPSPGMRVTAVAIFYGKVSAEIYVIPSEARDPHSVVQVQIPRGARDDLLLRRDGAR